jgi:hypothetical protein
MVAIGASSAVVVVLVDPRGLLQDVRTQRGVGATRPVS